MPTKDQRALAAAIGARVHERDTAHMEPPKDGMAFVSDHFLVGGWSSNSGGAN